MLILAGLSLHIIMAALLLQPIKYHWIQKSADEELQDLNNAKDNALQAVKLKPNGCTDSNRWCGYLQCNDSVSIISFFLSQMLLR